MCVAQLRGGTMMRHMYSSEALNELRETFDNLGCTEKYHPLQPYCEISREHLNAAWQRAIDEMEREE